MTTLLFSFTARFLHSLAPPPRRGRLPNCSVLPAYTHERRVSRRPGRQPGAATSRGGARAHAPGPQGHSRAPIPGRRSRQLAPQRQPWRRAPPTRPPKGNHARDRPHGQEGRRPSGAGGGPNPTEAAANTGHPQHGGPVDSTMRSAGSAANQPRDQPTMGTPRVHPAEVAPGDVMRKYRPRAARNKRIAAWHSR